MRYASIWSSVSCSSSASASASRREPLGGEQRRRLRRTRPRPSGAPPRRASSSVRGDVRSLQGIGAVARQDRDHPDRVAHPPAADHLAHERRDLIDVALGAGRLVAEDDLLGRAPAERDLDARLELGARVVEAVDVRRRERHAERLAARDDRDLAHRIGAGGEHPDERMPGLVVRRSGAGRPASS